eukprot:Awhi_evm1s14464
MSLSSNVKDFTELQDIDSDLINNDSEVSNNGSESELTSDEDQQNDLNEIEGLVSRIGPNTKTISKGKRTKPTLCTRSTPIVLRSSLRKNNLRSAMLRKR